MKRYVATLAIVMLPSLAGADVSELAMPSGQQVALQEIVASNGEVRFRFVTPDISRETGYLTYADVEQDFQALCQQVALPWLVENSVEAPMIVVSMAEQPTVLGKSYTDVTQFFEAFRPEGDLCIWEQF